jgi:hypothetical protein
MHSKFDSCIIFSQKLKSEFELTIPKVTRFQESIIQELIPSKSTSFIIL